MLQENCQMMLDDLERCNDAPNTVRSYLHAVEEFARHFRRSPDSLDPITSPYGETFPFVVNRPNTNSCKTAFTIRPLVTQAHDLGKVPFPVELNRAAKGLKLSLKGSVVPRPNLIQGGPIIDRCLCATRPGAKGKHERRKEKSHAEWYFMTPDPQFPSDNLADEKPTYRY